jgi:hypothetical protein
VNKIPTLFRRSNEDRRYVLNEVNPGCEWVLAGEGTACRKYDGTCVMYDGERWWARREVKPGKKAPDGYVPLSTDEVTGKTVGWEPIEQSAFFKFLVEAGSNDYGIADEYQFHGGKTRPGTYELIGPKVNGNPERTDSHLLIRHGYRAAVDDDAVRGLVRDFDSLAAWLAAHDWEGIVWHHPDGRMAKLKKRDFR